LPYSATQRVATDISINYTGESDSDGPKKGTQEDESIDISSLAIENLNSILVGLEKGAIDKSDNLSLPSVYVYYPDLVNTTESNGIESSSSSRIMFWYHPDYLGNVDLITEKDGNAHEFFMYNPWGEQMHQWNANTYGFSSPYRFNGKELDPETGLAYYSARYYQSKVSIWLSIDLKAAEYPSVSGYTAMNNNPLLYIDPNGMENIVVVGSQSDNSAGNKLMFANQGIRAIKEMSKNSPNESRSMIIFTEGYTDDQLSAIEKSVKSYGGTLVKVNSSEEFTNYVNSKSSSGGELSGARENDKITTMEIYSHGLPGSIEFGYEGKSESKYKLDASNVSNLNPGAFNGTNSTIYSYACRTGTGSNINFIGPTFMMKTSKSLAQKLANATGAHVVAFPVRTDYQFTLGTWSERRFSFPRAAPANYLIDGGAFMPTGAAHPVTAGGSPFGFYSGEMNFYPKN